MENEALHEMFAKVVDASFAFTMAFNTHGADSPEAHAAHDAYTNAMREYQEAVRPFPQSQQTHWDNFCSLNPEAPECLVYDL